MDHQNLNLQDLGKSIRRERLARKLKQSDLAKKSYLTRQTIISIEKGCVVSTISLMRIIAAMGCAIEIKPVRPDYQSLGALLDES